MQKLSLYLLDPENLSNFRSVSKLSFISKFIEKEVAAQLNAYLSTNPQLKPFQLAYMKFHGTETTLLSLHNDILNSLDSRQNVLLVLINLPETFYIYNWL